MELGFIPLVGLGFNPPCPTDACRTVLAQLPGCYSSQFDLCADELDAAHARNETSPTLSPECQKYWTIQQSDRAAWDSAIDAMPHCPAPSAPSSAPLFVGAAAGLVVGVLVGLGLGIVL